MKDKKVLLVAILFGVFTFILNAIYWHKREAELQNIAEGNTKVLKEQLESFDSRLGQAKQMIDDNGLLIKKYSELIPKDLENRFDAYDLRIEMIGTAVASLKVAGGGRVTREVIKETIKMPSGETKVVEKGVVLFQDYRIKAKLVEDIFTYELSQQFEVLLVETSAGSAHPFNLKLWELTPHGKRGTELRIDKFNIVRRGGVVPSFDWFNPLLDVGMDIGGRFGSGLSTAPQLGLSVMSYGTLGEDLEWRFLRLLGRYDAGFGFGACPISYNVAASMEVLTNVWLSPCYYFDSGHGILLSLGAVL